MVKDGIHSTPQKFRKLNKRHNLPEKYSTLFALYYGKEMTGGGGGSE